MGYLKALKMKCCAMLAFLVAYVKAYFAQNVRVRKVSFWKRALLVAGVCGGAFCYLSMRVVYATISIDLSVLTDVIGPLITLAVVGMIFKKIEHLG